MEGRRVLYCGGSVVGSALKRHPLISGRVYLDLDNGGKATATVVGCNGATWYLEQSWASSIGSSQVVVPLGCALA
jgi:hypothetical protein